MKIMEIGFRLLHHWDLAVIVGDREYNFGYNYIFGFPGFIWLANIELGNGNFFRGLEISGAEGEMSRDSGKYLGKVINFARRLPLGIRQFNTEANGEGLSFWTDGSRIK